MFGNTRDYHNARKAWLAKLPEFKYDLEPEGDLMFIDDLDHNFGGKRGVSFTYNNVFYHFRRVAHKEQLLGFTKLLCPHFASLFVSLDDLQAISSGKYSLTKSMELELLPNFEFASQDLFVDIKAEISQTAKGREVKTMSQVRDTRNGQLVATSNGVFVSTESIVVAMDSQLGQDIGKSWEECAPLRLAGKHPKDPTMSFLLSLPRPHIFEIPIWWREDACKATIAKKPSVILDGRMELYNIQLTKCSGVRAVAYPMLTAEGAPGLAHGASTVAVIIEVLGHLVPQLKMKKLQVRFKRRIELERKLAIEIEPSKTEGKWTAQILDWERTILQEFDLVEQQNSINKL